MQKCPFLLQKSSGSLLTNAFIRSLHCLLFRTLLYSRPNDFKPLFEYFHDSGLFRSIILWISDVLDTICCYSDQIQQDVFRQTELSPCCSVANLRAIDAVRTLIRLSSLTIELRHWALSQILRWHSYRKFWFNFCCSWSTSQKLIFFKAIV